MDGTTTLGQQIRKRRKELGRYATQEWLAEKSGLSADYIGRLERGDRAPSIQTLRALAAALDCEVSYLIDLHDRMGDERDGASVLALRDALLSPTDLPGWRSHADTEPASLAELDRMVTKTWGHYWTGEFGELLENLPKLLAEARRVRTERGPDAARGLSLAYELAAHLATQIGRTDLGTIAAERSILAAHDGTQADELLHAAQYGTYSWTLHHQGRYAEAERIAASMADTIEPVLSRASDLQIGVWGHLLLSTIAPSVAADKVPKDYLALARSGAERLGGRRVRVFQSSFAMPSVLMQQTYAYATLRMPDEALKAAKLIGPADLTGISRGAHLMDVAEAHWTRGWGQAAEDKLREAYGISAVWFRHQPKANAVVQDIKEHQSRLTPGIRELAAVFED